MVVTYAIQLNVLSGDSPDGWLVARQVSGGVAQHHIRMESGPTLSSFIS